MYDSLYWIPGTVLKLWCPISFTPYNDPQEVGTVFPILYEGKLKHREVR